MGGEGGFLDKLRQMMMGSRPPTAPPQAMPEGKPWEDPSLAPPMHQMPGSQMMPGAQHPGPMPTGQDDITAQVQQLMKQREIAKRLIPEQGWNK
jgi:hypothetical protein